MEDDIGLGRQIKKVEKTSLQKFKNQNAIIKKFDKPGLKVYRAIRKNGISIGELMKKVGLPQDELFEILTFLKDKGMVETVEGGEAEPKPFGSGLAEAGKALLGIKGPEEKEPESGPAARAKPEPAPKPEAKLEVRAKAKSKAKARAKAKKKAKPGAGPKAKAKKKAAPKTKKAKKPKKAAGRKKAAKAAPKAKKAKARAKPKAKAGKKAKPAPKKKSRLREMALAAAKKKGAKPAASPQEAGEEPELEKREPAERKSRPEPATIAPAEEIVPEEEEEEKETAGEEFTSIDFGEGEGTPGESKESGGEEEEEIVPLGDSAISPEDEFGIGPVEPGEEEEKEAGGEEGQEKEVEGGESGEKEEGKEGGKGEEEEIPEPAEEDELVPLDLGEDEEEAGEEGEKEGEAEEEDKEGAGEEGEEYSTSNDKIAPDRNEDVSGGGEEEDEDIFLTPGEKKIKGKYGEKGIKVYNLIDGQRTAEEIMRSTGVTEKTLIEMLDFMEKEGIIKLEHPGTKKPGGAPPSGKPSAPSAKEVGFAPMLEESTTPEKPLGGEEGKVFTLVVPHKLKGGMLREIQAKTNLMLKFKQPGVKVFEMINGSRDAVELSIKSGLPLYTVYEILKVLEKDGVVKLEPSVRTEIQRKYGEDGYSVYKRYGREGVMLYQLIGKDMDLRTMARQTSKDKERVVEIFMFIHKLLGIELPIDEDVLLERLKSTTPD